MRRYRSRTVSQFTRRRTNTTSIGRSNRTTRLRSTAAAAQHRITCLLADNRTKSGRLQRATAPARRRTARARTTLASLVTAIL